MLGCYLFFSESFFIIFHSINNDCFKYVCVFSWWFGMFIQLLVVFFITISCSIVLSYPSHWTDFIDFLFLCPNHCLFCVNQRRLGYTAARKYTTLSMTYHSKVYFLLKVLCSQGISPKQLFSTWQLRIPGCFHLWHLHLDTVVQGPRWRWGSMVESSPGILCISWEVTAVISVDIPFTIK